MMRMPTGGSPGMLLGHIALGNVCFQAGAPITTGDSFTSAALASGIWYLFVEPKRLAERIQLRHDHATGLTTGLVFARKRRDGLRLHAQPLTTQRQHQQTE
jgi:hypothetical protein